MKDGAGVILPEHHGNGPGGQWRAAAWAGQRSTPAEDTQVRSERAALTTVWAARRETHRRSVGVCHQLVIRQSASLSSSACYRHRPRAAVLEALLGGRSALLLIALLSSVVPSDRLEAGSMLEDELEKTDHTVPTEAKRVGSAEFRFRSAISATDDLGRWRARGASFEPFNG